MNKYLAVFLATAIAMSSCHDNAAHKTEKANEPNAVVLMAPPPEKNKTAAPQGYIKFVPPNVKEDSEVPFGDFSKDVNTESYNVIAENDFKAAQSKPLSTFSIDVDRAAYANVRRFLNMGQKPPKDAVRIEEMINYFDYDYPQPQNDQPFEVISETGACPWNPKHQLLHIGLQGKKVPTQNLPLSNLVFLIDVSGSMDEANKLPLVKASLKMLTDNLRDNDHVAIVVYAGAAGAVLPSTKGSNKAKIKEAIDNLSAGGSTAGGEGIQLAYKIAQQNFVKNGNNRIILATDGDFNVGASGDNDMERLITKERESGVFLTCLGFGMGNYKDSKMETLANKGNGNYGYIDNMQEAQKMFIKEFGGTLFTIAKDVKIQIEFNPTKVAGYRLIGYENRLLKDEDFKDDKKDAGELGSGHTVTALYEIIPVGVENSALKNDVKNVDPLKYQLNNPTNNHQELATIKLRYKKPDAQTSVELVKIISADNVIDNRLSDNFRFSASVALFGMLLRESQYKGVGDYKMVLNLAERAKGSDTEGYRSEFMRLVKTIH
jgi:Ca-activated chloride channel homolog